MTIARRLRDLEDAIEGAVDRTLEGARLVYICDTHRRRCDGSGHDVDDVLTLVIRDRSLLLAPPGAHPDIIVAMRRGASLDELLLIERSLPPVTTH
jgi:hypothetical protein